ncbi:hypothetical protein G7B40_027395 [Aetokthonos hydrillicola Thurmond2011]|uniref:Uncharacterized protein n=1 Tax=Aetokthonos hydrillicola Thurmond2011 TaxID=2712845 RepID=A0AAP5IB37_9CYAN|nr:hypothetical protein [Aetokthonos hydrillicola]MBO3463036.1 hypothetical protein [Aetokthonos hydrillicola CCALA 1050]MBW4588918.1 hypothetical protein [Aetokthonos hydrillicola CCALA 1050]MDR9898256.1 hypothetical protein [Aetokthonos hydrillicola Thurmond2011]
MASYEARKLLKQGGSELQETYLVLLFLENAKINLTTYGNLAENALNHQTR